MSNVIPIRKSIEPVGPIFVARDQCPACGGTNGRTFYECGFNQSPIKDYLYWFYSSQGGYVDLNMLGDGIYQLVSCDDCSLVYQGEILDERMMGVLYDEWIDSELSYKLATRAGVDRYLRDAAEVKRIVSMLNREPHTMKVLDFGMGWARWIRMALSIGCDAYGAELSLPRIEHAKRYGIKVVGWHEMKLHEFCVINTDQVFGRIPDPYETLVHLKACLQPEGVIKINVSNGAGIEAKVKKIGWDHYEKHSAALNPVAPLEHINCFTYDSLLTMADRAGMKVVKPALSDQMSGFFKLTKPLSSFKTQLKPVYRRFNPSTYVFLTHK